MAAFRFGVISVVVIAFRCALAVVTVPSRSGGPSSVQGQQFMQRQQQGAALDSRTATLPIALSKHLVWLSYIFPNGGVWDAIHDGHVKDGGIWNYTNHVEQKLDSFLEKRHPQYSSLWDVACNLGLVLGRLSQAHPERKYYGSDISGVMVNATKHNCPSCIADVFDLQELQSSSFGITLGRIPQPADIIIVADVLYYIPWGGFPPFLSSFIPASWMRSYRTRFWRHLTGLAKTEVIFTDHEGNADVRRILTEMGATFLPDEGFWVTPGTYSQLQNEQWLRVGYQRNHMHDGLLRSAMAMPLGIAIITCMMLACCVWGHHRRSKC